MFSQNVFNKGTCCDNKIKHTSSYVKHDKCFKVFRLQILINIKLVLRNRYYVRITVFLDHVDPRRAKEHAVPTDLKCADICWTFALKDSTFFYKNNKINLK